MLDPERGWSLSSVGCGFLAIYYVGVSRCLAERAPHVLRDARMMLGASSGSLFCASLLPGLPIVKIFMDLILWARSRNLSIFHPSINLMEHLRTGLHQQLPDNIHELLSGKVYPSLPRGADWKNVLVSEFQSKEEVIDALLCSSFIPFYSSFIPPSFRGVVCTELCVRGDLDTVKFLEEDGICDRLQWSLSAPSEELQVLVPPWPQGVAALEEKPEDEFLAYLRCSIQQRDKSFLQTVSSRLILVLRQAMKDTDGSLGKICNLLPVKVLSYALLPCTLPVELAFYTVRRLVLWVPRIPEDLPQLQWVASYTYSLLLMRLFHGVRPKAPESSTGPPPHGPEDSGPLWPAHPNARPEDCPVGVKAGSPQASFLQPVLTLLDSQGSTGTGGAPLPPFQ